MAVFQPNSPDLSGLPGFVLDISFELADLLVAQKERGLVARPVGVRQLPVGLGKLEFKLTGLFWVHGGRSLGLPLQSLSGRRLQGLWLSVLQASRPEGVSLNHRRPTSACSLSDPAVRRNHGQLPGRRILGNQPLNRRVGIFLINGKKKGHPLVARLDRSVRRWVGGVKNNRGSHRVQVAKLAHHRIQKAQSGSMQAVPTKIRLHQPLGMHQVVTVNQVTHAQAFISEFQ